MILSTLLPQSLTFTSQPINRYKGTLLYLLMNVEGALLQIGLAQWCGLIKQPHPPSPKLNNSSSDGSVVVSVSHSQRPKSLLSLSSDSFDKPMIELRQDLDMCDSGCPNQHYTRVDDVKRQGHPLIYSNDSGCSSKLRILRAASAHLPVLRTLQINLYSALSSHRCIASLDKALSAGDFQALLAITKTDGFEGLFDGNGVTAKNQECDHQTNCAGAAFSDTPLEILHADLISAYEKELVQTDPVHVCCSCEQLHKRRNMSEVRFLTLNVVLKCGLD